jgi:hypothetical protein
MATAQTGIVTALMINRGLSCRSGKGRAVSGSARAAERRVPDVTRVDEAERELQSVCGEGSDTQMKSNATISRPEDEEAQHRGGIDRG